ncbi:putative dioxygenase Rieske iron-sulfur component [Kalymmatonema gypsitolerans NIES-4073]|nr:putative dioxygenase Rieske iron-sulfur component [Scytonema sp. NIES-4073]
MSVKLEQVKEQTREKKEDKKEKVFPASWYIAMESKALGKKPQAIVLFGQDLVAWRDENGKPVIMERYCSHLGASLAISKRVDGCLECPYHKWRYDNSGQCVSIPNVENIPSKARQVTYTTVEKYDHIWVWYGSKTPLFPVPVYLPAEKKRQKDYMAFRFAVESKIPIVTMIENMYDYRHYTSVHSLPINDKVPIEYTLQEQQHPEQQNELFITPEAWYRGVIDMSVEKYVLEQFGGITDGIFRILGIKFKKMTHIIDTWPTGHVLTMLFDDREVMRVMLGSTPINANHSIGVALVRVKKTGNFLLDIIFYMLFAWQSKVSSKKDLPIWGTMKIDGGKIFVKDDYLLLKFREFYRKWIDKAE